MRYVINTNIVTVTEKTQVVSAVVVDRDLPTQRIKTKRESLGWFITVRDGVSFRIGDKRPELEPGDKVKISIERVVVL